MWQLLDLQWLQNNLTESIWYCHSQPPLFNLLTGIVVKIFPDNFYLVFHLMMLLFSWASSLLLFATLRRLNISWNICFLTTTFFLINPALVLYENLYSYTMLTVFLMVSILYFLVKFVHEGKLSDWILFLATGGALCLTRSSFHFIWLVLLLPLVWSKIPRSANFKAAYCAVLLIVVGWYVKNLVVFDTFSSSSWFGMNIARLIPPKSELGDIGPFKPVSYYPLAISSHDSFREVDALSKEFKDKGYINFNHHSYLEISRRFKADVTSRIQAEPGTYVDRVGDAFIAYFNPSTHAPFVEKNLTLISPYAKIMTGDFSSWQRYDRSSISVNAALPALAIYFIVFAVTVFFLLAKGSDQNTKVVTLFLAFMITYGMLVGNLFEYGENNRFRFETHTCFLTILALMTDRYLRNFRNSCRQKDSM